MTLKSGIAFVGALVALLLIAVFYFVVGIGWIMAGVVVGIGLVSYIVAAIGVGSGSSLTSFGEFMRGWLIGLNAALNGFLAFSIVALLAGAAAGAGAGVALGSLNLLTVFAPLSQSELYQGFLGWTNWLMPMSWPIVVLGLLFYIVSFLVHGVTGGKVPYLRVEKLGADWKTGTFFMRGGLIANLNYLDTAFNMGDFSFVDYKSGEWHKEHEAGHTLNLAAFGCVFHLVGAFDENATPRGANALSERLAESNASGTNGSNIPMWA